jgi:hypothetical protein
MLILDTLDANPAGRIARRARPEAEVIGRTDLLAEGIDACPAAGALDVALAWDAWIASGGACTKHGAQQQE